MIEAITNFIVGILTSFLIQEVYYHVSGLQVSSKQSMELTAIFTAASLFRGYIIRRIFNKYEKSI